MPLLSLFSSVAQIIKEGMALFTNIVNWLQRNQAREEGKAIARDEQISAAKKADDAIQAEADKPELSKDDILKRLDNGDA